MLVTVSETLKTFDGQAMKDSDGQGNAIDATLKLALVNALLNPVQNEPGVDKIKKYELARKIYKAGNEVELTAEEITLCKKRVGEVFPNPIVVGQVFEILEDK
jgi:hypothetical protein